MLLEEQDFQLTVYIEDKVDNKEVKITNKEVEIISWKNPEESVPFPAWIVVLLDFSGSMNRDDSSGTKRFEGAIEAIRRFLEITSARGGDTKVAIIPFSKDPYQGCEVYEVKQEDIKSKFLPANDSRNQDLLDKLVEDGPCGLSTDIYSPLKETIRLLGDKEDKHFYPEDSTEAEPRLSVILLSDGFHNQHSQKPNFYELEERDFKRLIDLLELNDNIVVHTLGYGLTQEQLGEKYNLGRPATRADVAIGQPLSQEKPIPSPEFVDEKRLREMAEVSGGISEFSGDADDIAEALQLFLNSLLGEYEIIYREPNPVRASKHEVFVTATVNGKDVDTTQKSYTINAFGRSLPWQTRLSMTVFVLLLLLLGGVLPFWTWSQKLKEEAEEDF